MAKNPKNKKQSLERNQKLFKITADKELAAKIDFIKLQKPKFKNHSLFLVGKHLTNNANFNCQQLLNLTLLSVSLIESPIDTSKDKGILLCVLTPMNHMRIFDLQYIHPDLEK